jgi:rod shape-determining protein MreD
MKWVVMMVLTVVCAIVQMTVPPIAMLGGAKAPVMFCLVLYYALEHDTAVLVSVALLAGMLQDALGLTPLGLSTLCFCAVGVVAGGFRRLVLSDSAVIAAVFGFAGCMVATLCSYALLVRDGLVGWTVWTALWKSTGTGLLGAVLAPPLFALTGGIDRRLGNVRLKREIHGID